LHYSIQSSDKLNSDFQLISGRHFIKPYFKQKYKVCLEKSSFDKKVMSRDRSILRSRREMLPIEGSFFFALSNSYYLSYDGAPGAADKIIEKSVTFGINVGT